MEMNPTSENFKRNIVTDLLFLCKMTSTTSPKIAAFPRVLVNN